MSNDFIQLKELVMQYIRDNLKVKVKTEQNDYDGAISSISVTVLLEGEEISYDSAYLR